MEGAIDVKILSAIRSSLLRATIAFKSSSVSAKNVEINGQFLLLSDAILPQYFSNVKKKKISSHNSSLTFNSVGIVLCGDMVRHDDCGKHGETMRGIERAIVIVCVDPSNLDFVPWFARVAQIPQKNHIF